MTDTEKIALIKKDLEEAHQNIPSELPTIAPDGAIWPFEGTYYLRHGDTWTPLCANNSMVLDDELSMSYMEGIPTGLCPNNQWWKTNEAKSTFNDGDNVRMIIFKTN